MEVIGHHAVRDDLQAAEPGHFPEHLREHLLALMVENPFTNHDHG
jgi:hypothetical protein